jgi:SAM-dependent methyltransferase
LDEFCRSGWNDGELRNALSDSYRTPDLAENAHAYARSPEFEAALSELAGLGIAPAATVRVLDLGCGNGAASWALARFGYAVTAYDSESGDLLGTEAARRVSGLDGIRFEIANGSLRSLPYPDATFSVVWMRGTLARWEDREKLLAEARRVLVPGGIAVVLRAPVAWNAHQKSDFEDSHPLRGLAHGERAQFLEDLLQAFSRANLRLLQLLDPSASPVNGNVALKREAGPFEVDSAVARARGTDLFTFFAARAAA